MLVRCACCGNSFEVKNFKGMPHTPMVCSADCLKEFFRDKAVDPRLFARLFTEDGLNGLRAFDNITNFAVGGRSEIELKIAEFFDKNGIAYEYEKYSLMLDKDMYLPDFFLPRYNIFIEVKYDVWERGAYAKLRRMSYLYPIYLITKEIYDVWK